MKHASMQDFISWFLEIDTQLEALVGEYGAWCYAILWLVIFCETGLVVTPFLPGDSLLFAAGAVAASQDLNVHLMFVLLVVAAVAGDTFNYFVGAKIGPRAFNEKLPFLKREYLDRTHAFYERHGGKAVVLGRFVPIIRTFVPFVAGIGSMTYSRFVYYNILGAVAWVAICLYAGFMFGNIPFVKRNFEIIVLAVIAVSVLPIAIEALLQWRRARKGTDHETQAHGPRSAEEIEAVVNADDE